MTNDEAEEGIDSSRSSPNKTDQLEDSGTRSDVTPPTEAQQSRFSFYDAKAVGSIGVGSSSSPSKEEVPNPNRFNFYDPSMVGAVDVNLPNTKIDFEDLKQNYKIEKKSDVHASDVAATATSTATINDDNNQIPTEEITKKEIEKNNADEILRSLQETEDQRIQILQSATVPILESSGSVLGSGTLRGANDAVRGHSSPIKGVDIAGSTAKISAAIATNANTVCDGNGNNNLDNNNNPYENSIRAALTLLRKHRSSPKNSSCDNNTINTLGSENNEYNDESNELMNGIKLDRDRTVNGLQDPILQTRSCDDGDADQIGNGKAVDDAVQEAKMKSKQRQERMAKYASRLQELKSSLPPEQQLTPQFSSSFTQSPYNGNNGVDGKGDDNRSKSSLLEQTNIEEDKDQENISSQSEQQLPNHIHRHIKPSLTEDSTGLVSELSQYSNSNNPQRSNHSQLPYQQQAIIEEQVQKGVERVLVAILEASKNKSMTASVDSSCGERSNAITNRLIDDMSTDAGENMNDALLQVLHDLLPSSRSNDDGSINSRDIADGMPTTLSSKYSASVVSTESSVKNRSAKSSVVDDLLAEVDEEDHSSKSKIPFTAEPGPKVSCMSNVNETQYWAEGDEKKMTEDRRYTENKQVLQTDSTSVILSTINQQGKKNNKLSVTTDIDAHENEDDDGIDNSVFESDASAEDDSVSRSSYSDDEDDEMDTAYEGNEDSYNESENEEEQHIGVLGPLSREAGGTTGVVLDVESDSSPSSTREKEEKVHFSSVVNYVTSSRTEDEQRILDYKKKLLANYDVVGTTTNIQDEEATELMRTLCAHLLPFGVDQNSVGEESTPTWDEENPNEPGYRIIRLSKSQLRRVERAFDAMITRLKLNSQTSLNGLEGQFDENFIRELEEAERLLDDEEKRTNNENEVGNVSGKVTTEPKATPAGGIVDEEDCVADTSHPEFPGVKSAGKGEMGDLEYFQLPIIFKSHVTGFEPTKDMTLEQGNIIAGQYLVEGELGSAAFSTAYRCVDLSSEQNGVHEEVCLKVIKNTKDFFDQSLDEIKILELLRQTGKCDENYILRVKTFFYYREHLIIVTELLRQNLYDFGKYILDNDEEPYFTLPRLAYITRQCLIALRFVHNLGLVHSDVKPENILLGSYSRAQIKLIDFGSSCYLTDRQSSYIQSRSYRAPEVVLGLPYDGKIDVWSLGCVVAEMYTGEVTFQNDSIVSMLSRIEAFRGPFPRHMIAQGRQCGRYFTKSGLLYEVVGRSDEEEGPSVAPPAPDDEESDTDSELERMEFDIFQPKTTQLSSRLGFDANLMDGYGRKLTSKEHELEQMFTDFVAKLLTIDPDGRPSAEEALNHPYMLHAASLTDDQIKYPSS